MKTPRPDTDIVNKVREILLHNWDPLSVGDNAHLADEYDSIIPGLLAIIRSTGNADSVAGYLEEAEQQLGVSVPNEHRIAVAGKLIAMGQS